MCYSTGWHGHKEPAGSTVKHDRKQNPRRNDPKCERQSPYEERCPAGISVRHHFKSGSRRHQQSVCVTWEAEHTSVHQPTRMISLTEPAWNYPQLQTAKPWCEGVSSQGHTREQPQWNKGRGRVIQDWRGEGAEKYLGRKLPSMLTWSVDRNKSQMDSS